MKLFKTVLSAGVLAAPITVLAASPTSTLSVHVPFSFVMAGEEFEPGDYRVQQTDNGVICVQGGGKSVMAISVPASVPATDAPSVLRFASGHLIGVQTQGVSFRLLPQEQPERNITITPTR